MTRSGECPPNQDKSSNLPCHQCSSSSARPHPHLTGEELSKLYIILQCSRLSQTFYLPPSTFPVVVSLAPGPPATLPVFANATRNPKKWKWRWILGRWLLGRWRTARKAGLGALSTVSVTCSISFHDGLEHRNSCLRTRQKIKDEPED